MNSPTVKDGWVLLTGTKKSTSFITSCPECDTQFIVKDEQLKAYNGQVRCGDCSHVFNALEHIVQEHKPASPTEDKISSILDSVSLGGDTITEVSVTDDVNNSDTAPSSDFLEPTAVETSGKTIQNTPDLASDLNINRKFRIKRNKKPFSWLLFSVCSLFLIVLIGQLTYALRTEISAYYPKTKPWLKLACAKIGCQIELPKKITLITIDDSDMHENTSYQDALQFSSTLVNHASYVQAYPLVELTLTDIDDKPVLRRTFTAQEYLPEDANPEAGIAANEEIRIKINLSSSDIPVAGYRVTVKY